MTIKEMRDSTGLTQKAFAANLGIPLGTIRRWEYGESTPPTYVLALIAEKLPQENSALQKIESKNGIYYYDQTTNSIIDQKGTRIRANEDLAGVKESNLVLYANALFEAYYDAVSSFDKDCMLDKKEDILWG